MLAESEECREVPGESGRGIFSGAANLCIPAQVLIGLVFKTPKAACSLEEAMTVDRGQQECEAGQGCSGGELAEVQASFTCELGAVASVERAHGEPSGGRGVALCPIPPVASLSITAHLQSIIRGGC